MGKTAYIAARIEPKLKAQAEGVLEKLGVNTTAALTMFYQQVVLQKGMPFDVRLPNAETARALSAMRKPSSRSRMQTASTANEMLDAILGKTLKKKTV